MTLASLLSRWRSTPEVATNVVEWRTLSARAAQFEPFPENLTRHWFQLLRAQKIQALYTHQSEAWETCRAGM